MCSKDEVDKYVAESSGRISETARSHGERFSRELSNNEDTISPQLLLKTCTCSRK